MRRRGARWSGSDHRAFDVRIPPNSGTKNRARLQMGQQTTSKEAANRGGVTLLGPERFGFARHGEPSRHSEPQSCEGSLSLRGAPYSLPWSETPRLAYASILEHACARLPPSRLSAKRTLENETRQMGNRFNFGNLVVWQEAS